MRSTNILSWINSAGWAYIYLFLLLAILANLWKMISGNTPEFMSSNVLLVPVFPILIVTLISSLFNKQV
jgi:hypothetical protein